MNAKLLAFCLVMITYYSSVHSHKDLKSLSTYKNLQVFLPRVENYSEVLILLFRCSGSTLDFESNESELVEIVSTSLHTELNTPVRFICINHTNQNLNNISETTRKITLRYSSKHPQNILLTFDIPWEKILNVNHLIKISPYVLVFVLSEGDNVELIGKFVPRYAVLVNSNGLFRLCLFCVSASRHSWRVLGRSDIFQTEIHNFNKAPLMIENVQDQRGFVTRKFLSLSIAPTTTNTEWFITHQVTNFYNFSTSVCPLFDCYNMSHDIALRYIEKLKPGIMFDYGESYKTSFIIPTSHEVLDWEGMMGPIGYQVISWTLGFCLFTAVWLYLSIKLGRNNKPFEISKAMELAFRPVLDQYFEKLPSTKIYFRLCFIPWLFYCLIITESYRGELVGYLIRPSFENAPRTFDELIKSGRKYFTFGSTFNQSNGSCAVKMSNSLIIIGGEYKFIRAEKYRQLLNNLNDCGSMEQSFLRAYERWKRGEAFIGRINELVAMIDRVSQLPDESITGKLYHFVSDYIYQPEILKLFGNLRDSGITGKYIKESQSTSINNFQTSIPNKYDEKSCLKREEADCGPQTLRISNLQALLYLTIGLELVSTLSFCIEYLFHFTTLHTKTWVLPRVKIFSGCVD